MFLHYEKEFKVILTGEHFIFNKSLGNRIWGPRKS